MVATSCFLRSSLHSLNVRLHTTITCMLWSSDNLCNSPTASDRRWDRKWKGKRRTVQLQMSYRMWLKNMWTLHGVIIRAFWSYVGASLYCSHGSALRRERAVLDGCFCNQPCTCHKATIVDQLPSAQCASPLHQSANSWPGDMSTLPGDPGPSHGRMSDSFNLTLGWDATGELFLMNDLAVKATVDTKSTLEKRGLSFDK